jgi:hypothetical protein
MYIHEIFKNIKIYIESSNHFKKIIDKNILKNLWTKTLKSTLNIQTNFKKL